jgi:hypothetical protein
MANSVTTQILVDGAVNAVVKIVGILDTSDVAPTAVVDPASFTPTPTQFRIDRVTYTVEEGLDVRLQWDATSPVYIIDYVKAGHQDFKKFGGLQNNAGAGKTGKILLSTEGWTAGTHEFTIVLELVKQGV